eukprot:gene8042-1436_t
MTVLPKTSTINPSNEEPRPAGEPAADMIRRHKLQAASGRYSINGQLIHPRVVELNMRGQPALTYSQSHAQMMIGQSGAVSHLTFLRAVTTKPVRLPPSAAAPLPASPMRQSPSPSRGASPVTRSPSPSSAHRPYRSRTPAIPPPAGALSLSPAVSTRGPSVVSSLSA